MPLSQIDPANYQQLLRDKCDQVLALLAPFGPPPPTIVASDTTAYRMRAEFRMWHRGDALNYVMFRRDDPRTPVDIDDMPIACETIQRLMPPLRERLQASPELRRKIFQVEFLSALSGDTLITLAYHRKLDESWEAAASALALELGVSIVGRSRRQKLVLGRDYITETLTVDGRQYHYRQYEQAFTQPNARVNTRMIEWACDAASELDGDLLELYCGNGNFTLPLARHFDHVIATELAKSSIRAARWNLEHNNVDNVAMIRLAAEEVTQAMNGEREFRRLADLPRPLGDYDLRSVFVDPPRAGLDPHTEAMVTRFETILYISCNPHTLASNLRPLDKSHRMERFALFDQFPYTHHMECGVVLKRR